MQRPVRPKSAKGKVRPVPPSRPRVESSVEESHTSTTGASYNQQYAPQPSTSGRYAFRRTTDNETSYTSYRKTDEKLHRQDNARNSINPKELPDVTRPVSSLSKFGILPGIPATPGTGDTRSVSPAESELEMELLSSLAQQMILDSAKTNKSSANDTRQMRRSTKISSVQSQGNGSHKSPLSRAMQGATTSNIVQQRMSIKRNPKPPPKQNLSTSNHQDGPLRKKSRTATTSVFNRSGNLSRIPPQPKEGEKRMKIALKLPDGRRVERYFSPTNTINDIMSFAQIKMRIPTSHCDIYSMVQVPKVLIKNWKNTLEQLDIRDRTVLYIDKKDEFSR